MKNKIISSDVARILSSEIIDWERFNGKSVLITGANGMLPSYLVYTLLELNNRCIATKVIALVRSKEKAERIFCDYLSDENLEILVQDVCNEIKYSGEIDFIIHAASQASPKFYGVDPVGTIMANVRGTENILRLATEKQCESVLYFSSGEVYGQVDNHDISETEYGYIDPTKVRSCYGESKRMGENLCVSWSYQYGTPVKIVRPFHTYGPGMQRNDGRVFADFAYNIFDNKDIVLRSDGSAERAFCYITDASIAYFKVLLDGKDKEAYNVGNQDACISIRNLAKMLVNLFPEKHLKCVFDIDENDMRTGKMKSPLTRSVPNTAKLKALCWNPSVTIEEGFKRTIENF